MHLQYPNFRIRGIEVSDFASAGHVRCLYFRFLWQFKFYPCSCWAEQQLEPGTNYFQSHGGNVKEFVVWQAKPGLLSNGEKGALVQDLGPFFNLGLTVSPIEICYWFFNPQAFLFYFWVLIQVQ